MSRAVSCPRCANLNPTSEPHCLRCGCPLASHGEPNLGPVADGLFGGRYRIEHEIGAGAMGRVHRAFDTSLNRHVALKILNPELIHHETARRRMEREAHALANISHPNVVRIHNVFTHGGSLVLDLELLRGGTLAGRIAAGAIPYGEALRLMRCMLAGLQAIHDAGLIHRDMKPSNVLMTAEGEPKIADLGIAHDLAGERITRVGTRLGTPQYMSPEQIRAKQVGFSTDIYACGVILFEMLTGTAPFDGDSGFDIEAAHVKTPPDLRKLDGLAPAPVIAAISRALDKAPERRWQTPRDLWAALSEVERTPLAPPAQVIVPEPAPPVTPHSVPRVIVREPEPQVTPYSIPTLPAAPVPRRAPPVRWLLAGAAATAVLGGIVALAVASLSEKSERGRVTQPDGTSRGTVSGTKEATSPKPIATPLATVQPAPTDVPTESLPVTPERPLETVGAQNECERRGGVEDENGYCRLRPGESWRLRPWKLTHPADAQGRVMVCIRPAQGPECRSIIETCGGWRCTQTRAESQPGYTYFGLSDAEGIVLTTEQLVGDGIDARIFSGVIPLPAFGLRQPRALLLGERLLTTGLVFKTNVEGYERLTVKVDHIERGN